MRKRKTSTPSSSGGRVVRAAYRSRRRRRGGAGKQSHFRNDDTKEKLEVTNARMKSRIAELEENLRVEHIQRTRNEREIERITKVAEELSGNGSQENRKTAAELRRLRAMLNKSREDLKARDAQISSLLKSQKYTRVMELELTAEEYLREVSRLREILKRRDEERKKKDEDAKIAIEASYKVVSELRNLKVDKVELEDRISKCNEEIKVLRLERRVDSKSGMTYVVFEREARELLIILHFQLRQKNITLISHSYRKKNTRKYQLSNTKSIATRTQTPEYHSSHPLTQRTHSQ